MNEKTSPDAQVPFDPALVAAAVAAARDDSRGICKLRRHGLAFTFDFEGEETILADDMRPFVERALGEELAECALPGLEGQFNLVPMSRAIALGICAAADIGRRRPTGLTNDASVLAPNCRGCVAIVPHGTTYCSACAIPAPDPSRLPMRSRMVVLLRKVHTLISLGQRSVLNDDVVPLVQDLTDEAESLAKELELAQAMEAALTGLSDCGWLDKDAREISSVAQAKAKAHDVVDDILLMQLTRD
ncbi:hypothetical protein LJR039_007124 [Pseudorhodoferax sp. LjRoot39]|uniref:hypothetical protein n=1 Tax=Pseudorhodoferax sp. LjRoot39 TaxID=3342328 RepID=UPI003ECDCB00